MPGALHSVKVYLDEATTSTVDVVPVEPSTRERLFEAIAHAVPDRVKSPPGHR